MGFVFPSFSSTLPIQPKHQKSLKIIKHYQQMNKIQGTPIQFWERSIFVAEKAFAPPEKHLGLNTQEESNLAPLGSQAGGLTTRPDLYGLGDGTMVAKGLIFLRKNPLRRPRNT